MATLYRPATRALLEAYPHQVPSASFGHSLISSSPATAVEPPESSGIPETLDVFNAQMNLRERNIPNEPSKALKSLSPAYVATKAATSYSESIYNNALGLPWSLPPPTTFDGPACPPHMSPSTLRQRRSQRHASTRFPTAN